GLAGLGLALSACSGGPHDCTETRTCRTPVDYIDAGDVDDWWAGGAAGEATSTSAWPEHALAGAAGEGASAGGGVGGASGASSEDSAVSARPPRVLSVSPPDGAIGVANDVELAITFGCPLDAAAFEAAYVSADLPAASLTFSWNEAHTVLTLSPKSALSYQAGRAEPSGGLEFQAKTYEYGFDALRCDGSGEMLAPARFSFSTLRQVSTELPADALHTGNWTEGEDEGIHNCLRSAQAPYAPSVCIGDDSNNVRYTGFVSFDLSAFPEGIRQWTSARLVSGARVYGSTGALGASLLEHVAFGELGGAALSTPPSESLGAFYSGAGLASGSRVELAEDVTSAVAADYRARTAGSALTQYRLSFAKIAANGAWDDIELSTAEIRLAATYLVP
ncbi:MAG TPA: Ig-like domain-containing protein, partial [Polyangiaceae bacterium]|nr:Ig-like domain-containing protein [Polyangiaceae bacterium]